MSNLHFISDVQHGVFVNHRDFDIIVANHMLTLYDAYVNHIEFLIERNYQLVVVIVAAYCHLILPLMLNNSDDRLIAETVRRQHDITTEVLSQSRLQIQLSDSDFRFTFQMQISDSDFRCRTRFRFQIQISYSNFGLRFQIQIPDSAFGFRFSDSSFRFRLQIQISDSNFKFRFNR